MLETLEQWGCETEKTMERFLDDKEFYQECYDLFIGGETMKKLKILVDIQDSYNELVHKVSWPTKSELANSAVVVMFASLIIAIVIFAMDQCIDKIMHLIYGGL